MSLLKFLKFLRKPKITDPFPWDERTSLVIYAAKSLDDNPDKTFPSLIFHNYNPKRTSLVVDGAPYLTVVTATEMQNEVNKWKNNPIDEQDYEQALKTKNWVYLQTTRGWTHFLYETEPPERAGDAYLWALHAERKKIKK